MNDIKERQALYFLMSTGLFSNNTLRKLKQIYGSYRAVYESGDDIAKILKSNKTEQYLHALHRTDIEYEYSRLGKKNASFYMSEEPEYPECFRQLADAPCAILVIGKLPSEHIPCVAIIGARNCSNYGRAMAEEYASYIASKNIQIISGMAMGIDGIAGQAAIDTSDLSFAVLGCGPDICYPACNRRLYEKLSERGGIISEYTLGTPGVGWHFPLRNRLISAFSDAILVIEAKEKSGTMITVDCALEQGKDVYALPGRSCDQLSLGCNQLISQGAGVLLSPEDFLSQFTSRISSLPQYSDFMVNSINASSAPGISFNTKEEQIIYSCLDHNPLSLDEIYLRANKICDISLPDIMVILSTLSISGHVLNISGTNYAKR